MNATELVERLEHALDAEATRHGLELVAVEQTGGRRQPVIRVLLDREGGIDIDTIAEANRWVSDVLDGEEGLAGPYVLEVSSPGIDRPLRKPHDFERFIGETATVKTRTEQGRATYTGRIADAEPTGILLEADDGEHRIAYDEIAKARLKGAIDFGSGRSAQNR